MFKASKLLGVRGVVHSCTAVAVDLGENGITLIIFFYLYLLLTLVFLFLFFLRQECLRVCLKRARAFTRSSAIYAVNYDFEGTKRFEIQHKWSML